MKGCWLMAKKKTKKAKIYTRTIKRYSLKINNIKWLLLLEILESYAKQKDYFLGQYNQKGNIYAVFSFRKLRKILVDKKYKSPFGLQNRQWKLALKDALELMDRYWAALAADWTKIILRADSLDKEEKAYLLKVISSRRRLHEILTNGTNMEFDNIPLTLKQRKHCIRYLEKLLKRTIKKAPRVKLVHSFLGEPETYRIFEHNGIQYIALTSKEPGVRLVLPLKGNKEIKGQIRIVFDFEKQRIEIHHAAISRAKKIKHEKKKIGIDLGITEVFTDSDGSKWGVDFGKTTQNYSDKLKDKGQKRNKLYTIAEKYEENECFKKANKIRKHNLGTKKQKKKNAKRCEELTRQVNEAINNFCIEKKPAKIVYEDLTHMRGKAKSKKMSRLVSLWIRGIIRKRLDFKSLEKDFALKPVNCAYSSSVCPKCYWPAKANRKGDKFKCKVCGFAGSSDEIAAIEILRRDTNNKIYLGMYKQTVLKILLDRFQAKLKKLKADALSKMCLKPVYKILGDKIKNI